MSYNLPSSALLKESLIKEYIKNVDFKRDFSVKQIKNELRAILHEFPSVELEYTKDEIITEVKGKKVKEENVKSITISYTDGFDSNTNIAIIRKCKLYV